MSLQLRVVHTTNFEYEGKAVQSYNQARLSPTTTPDQIVVYSRVEVSPSPWVFEYRDYFGTQVVGFEILDPHDNMTVTATSTVQVERTPAGDPTSTWDDIAAPEVADRWTEFLVLPGVVAPPPDLVERVRAIAAETPTPGAAARAVCDLVFREIQFLPGSTDVESPAARAWEQRSGVCQDMVHLVIGALRTLGIPARYVSGYFHPSDEPVVGETVPGESHAWVQWWDDGWHGYDPTNDVEPGDRYVAVATGRDYRDVRPLAGVYSGATTSRMDVEVTLTRLA